MLQTFVELYRYRGAWTELTPQERAGFVDEVLTAAAALADLGIEVVTYSFNDTDTDRRAPYDFFCVYQVPSLEVLRQFEKVIEGSGWYRYFDQVNLSGATLTPPALLMANARLEVPGTQTEHIPATSTYAKQTATVHGRSMSYVDHGAGRAVVFLHGDMMSSHLWRNVLPHLEGHGRLVAVDLIGAGDSDKLPDSGPGSYGFAEHARYLEGLLNHLDLGDDVVLVGHDWGANLAFDWAMRHPDRVAGVSFTEAVLPPFAWSDWPAELHEHFAMLRSPEGEAAVLERNAFVANVQNGVLRMLAPAERAEIERPYAEAGEARRPTLAWPREVPFDDDRSATRDAVEEHAAWMAASPLPKLRIRSDHGGLDTGRRAKLIDSWPATTVVRARGHHWPQEDDPHTIGAALRDWIADLPAR